ncbi:SDR family oxidoreductase [bacterium]|nr:SDR family oxidoreductase [bacterium]
MAKSVLFGATSAIGIEVAKLMAGQGDELFLVARDPQKLQAVERDLRARGAQVKGSRAIDLRQTEHHLTLFREIQSALGGIDHALIAYGTLSNQKACEQDFTLAAHEIQTNFVSCVSLLTNLANQMEQKRHGVIAVISSVAGDRGRQSNYIYGASKGALSIFLQGLRNRLFQAGVSVLTIKPGFVDTPMTSHLKKNFLFAQPETVALGIVRGMERKKDVIYVPGFWWWVMFIIRSVPEALFKRLKL